MINTISILKVSSFIMFRINLLYEVDSSIYHRMFTVIYLPKYHTQFSRVFFANFIRAFFRAFFRAFIPKSSNMHTRFKVNILRLLLSSKCIFLYWVFLCVFTFIPDTHIRSLIFLDTYLFDSALIQVRDSNIKSIKALKNDLLYYNSVYFRK